MYLDYHIVRLNKIQQFILYYISKLKHKTMQRCHWNVITHQCSKGSRTIEQLIRVPTIILPLLQNFKHVMKKRNLRGDTFDTFVYWRRNAKIIRYWTYRYRWYNIDVCIIFIIINITYYLLSIYSSFPIYWVPIFKTVLVCVEPSA